MKAIVCHQFGPPEGLVLEELPQPRPGAGQVRVEVHAIGLNFTDLLCVTGRSQLQRQLPVIPGCEAAGVVRELGPGVKHLQLGQRVLGTKTHGVWAEDVLFDVDEVAVIPDDMDMHTAATLFIASMTMRYALQDRARLAPGEILLVLGAGGGAGLAAVQIGKALGARVVAAASSEEKLALAKSHGADAVLAYQRGPLDLEGQKALTTELLALAGRSEITSMSVGAINSVHARAGYHVITDGIGGSYSEPALRALGWQGRYLSVGFAAGMPKVTLGPLLFKNADIMGIQPSADELRLPGRSPAAMKTLFDWFEAGKLQPYISACYPLAEAAAALRCMADRKATGRIVITTPRGHIDSGPRAGA